MKPIIQYSLIIFACLSLPGLTSCGGGGGGEKTAGSNDSGAASPQLAGKGGNVEYGSNARVPDYSKMDLGVYSIPADFKTSEAEGTAMLSRAGKLAGLAPKLTRNKEAGNEQRLFYSMSGDASAINAYDLRNSDLTFDAGMMKYGGADNTPNLLKGDAATKRAQEYLRQLDIKAGDNEMALMHTGGVNMGATDGKTAKVYEKFTTVQFGRKLDGTERQEA